MPWPNSDVQTNQVDDGTDSPAVARGHLYDLIQKFNLLRSHVKTQWQTILGQDGAYSPALVYPTFNSTPTFDAAASNMHEPAPLLGNVTAMSISNARGGMCINIRFQQDVTGGRTVAAPAGANIVGAINTAPNKVSWLSMFFSERAQRWEGSWTNMG